LVVFGRLGEEGRFGIERGGKWKGSWEGEGRGGERIQDAEV
jgi:hypothetical protein